ncbi:uncharacterized protein LOC108626688 [Ceratina calcarata]|uniref:Uncharacterized protein LOC108626688 n=1 Tax=Ceratina calcarata TaxID=156304 RepID=A0AAJ7WC41_9HYME|nr:uncharacterized protein LOC108626688 [Ceratina calcarata]
MDRPKTIINQPLEYSLRMFGVWPDTSFQLLKTVVWTIIMLTFLTFQCWYCVIHAKLGIVELLDGLSYALSNSLVFVKLILIWIHKRTFYKILSTVLKDWNDQHLSIENKRIMNDNAVLSSKISNFLICYFGISFLLYTGSTLALTDEDEITHQRKFLIRMEFPFEATTSPTYEIILVIQFLCELLIVYGAATLIGLTTALILHIGSQLDVLCERLTKISLSNEKDEIRKNAITEFITKHQKIIILSQNVERIFSYISLYQFLSNMMVICFISFVLAVSFRTGQAAGLIMKCFPYYVAINCEAFILCYTGEYLTSKSGVITKAVYNSLWYDLKPQEARLILLIIMRSQKQLTLTAGKFVDLSLEAFANMLKACASYVSVLYAIYLLYFIALSILMAMKSIISRPVEISLRLIGAWPNSSYRILKYILWTTIMLTFLIFQYWYCITHVKTDVLVDFLDGMSITLSNTLLFVKFVIIWFYNRAVLYRMFSETVLTMTDDWNDRKSEWNMELMIRKVTLSYRIAKYLLIMFLSSIFLYTASIFLASDEETEAQNELVNKKFLLRMELPFEATESPFYEIVVVVQLIVQTVFAMMSSMSMALIATFVIHVVGQIEVVCDKLSEILDGQNEEQLRLASMRSIIEKHQRIISLSSNIETVFTFIALVQFFFNILVICFVGFVLMTSLGTEEMVTVVFKCLPYYITINFEALILCYTGEYLSSNSETIGWVAYNSNWYELSIKENRTLLLLILRSQRPLSLTIGKFMNLSLETFANMLKASASYISVLYAME